MTGLAAGGGGIGKGGWAFGTGGEAAREPRGTAATVGSEECGPVDGWYLARTPTSCSVATPPPHGAARWNGAERDWSEHAGCAAAHDQVFRWVCWIVGSISVPLPT